MHGLSECQAGRRVVVHLTGQKADDVNALCDVKVPVHWAGETGSVDRVFAWVSVTEVNHHDQKQFREEWRVHFI